MAVTNPLYNTRTALTIGLASLASSSTHHGRSRFSAQFIGGAIDPTVHNLTVPIHKLHELD